MWKLGVSSSLRGKHAVAWTYRERRLSAAVLRWSKTPTYSMTDAVQQAPTARRRPFSVRHGTSPIDYDLCHEGSSPKPLPPSGVFRHAQRVQLDSKDHIIA